MPASELPSAAADRPLSLSVWFERVAVHGNRWIDHRWELVGLAVTPEDGMAETGPEEAGRVRRTCPPFALHGDEAEGYLLNVRADEPSLFLMLRPAEDEGADRAPRVAAVTASFHEAARWNDAGETVERVPLPEGWASAIDAYAQAHLKPPEEKRPKRRYASAGDKHERPGH